MSQIFSCNENHFVVEKSCILIVRKCLCYCCSGNIEFRVAVVFSHLVCVIAVFRLLLPAQLILIYVDILSSMIYYASSLNNEILKSNQMITIYTLQTLYYTITHTYIETLTNDLIASN